MKLVAIGVILGAFVSPSNAIAAPAKHSAWFMLTADGKQWCAFTSESSAKKAGASDRFGGSEWAMMDYRDDGIVKLIDSTESEDSNTDDTYSIDAVGRVKQVIRRGHYINDPWFSVIYVPDAKGKLTLTPASRATERQQAKAQHETYFLEWPLYPNLAKMPFGKLIQIKPVISVTERCIKGPPRPVNDD